MKIHPNDGFDLGVMTTDIVVKIYAGSGIDELEDPDTRFVYGKLYLENETTMGTCELSLKTVQKLGTPKKVNGRKNYPRGRARNGN